MENKSHNTSDGPRKLPLKLLEEITSNFAVEQILGSGAFSVVYKGILDGKEIAVKKLRFVEGISDKQFENEFGHLSKLKHQNIVQLVGFCDETKNVLVPDKGQLVSAVEIHRALCLEFVPHGCLRKFLSDQCLIRDWHVRFKIINGICEGLNYLHESSVTHFDLKPDNILLDEKMVPKIADFGLSRLMAGENTKITTSNLGTRGYIPPEFITDQAISRKYDIFSLGVILKRIMSGEMEYFSIASMGKQECIKHVHDYWEKKLQETARYASLEVDCKQVRSCIEIAVACTEKDRQKRPTIKEIVRKLNKLEVKENDSPSQIEQLQDRRCILPKRDIPERPSPAVVIPLSDLDPKKKCVTVCVRVSRMWDYCNNKDRKLAHVDLVLIDETRNKMYAEIGSGHAAKFKELLKEGGVYLLWDFFIEPSKNIFRAVEGKFMIRITPWTKVEPTTGNLSNFPYYAYSLTSFESLPGLVGKKNCFIDVFGIVASISGLLYVKLPGQSTESVRRNLQIMDIGGTTVDVALWGIHATEFDGDQLYKIGQSKAIMLLLVGTLIKNYRGRNTISCGEAAKIYVDPDIPERDQCMQSLTQQLPAIQWIDAENDHYRQTFQQSKPDSVKIEYLLTTDPNEYLGKNMLCTVTVMRVLPSSWWFLACAGCHKTAYTATDQFVCSDQECRCVAANPRYRVHVIGADATGEAEFVLFAGVAEQIIGKKVEALTRTAARRPDIIPAEIAALVSRKYTLNVSVNQRGLRYEKLSFQVNNIEVIHPKSKPFEFGVLGSSSNQQSNAPSGSGTVQPLLFHGKVQLGHGTHASAQVTDIQGESHITGDMPADVAIFVAANAPNITPAEYSLSMALHEMATLADEIPPATPPSIGEDKSASTDNEPSLTAKRRVKRPMESSQKSSIAKKLFK